MKVNKILLKKVLPNFIIIGAQKAGTTSMFSWLSQHPDIYVSFHLKDLPYFTTDLHKKGTDYYTKVFDNYNYQKIITTCETNAIFFEDTAKRIYDFNPEMKILALVRNPVTRAYSGYQYALQRGIESKSFKEAILEEFRNERKYDTHYKTAQMDYLKHGLYYHQLSHYFKFFRKDQIFIGIAEDMRSDREKVTREVFSFLEVNPDVPVIFSDKNKTHAGYHFGFINKLLNNEKTQQSSLLGKVFDTLPVAFSYKLKRKVYNVLSDLNQKYVAIPPMDEEDKHLLIKFYREDVMKLSELINRDLFTLWLK